MPSYLGSPEEGLGPVFGRITNNLQNLGTQPNNSIVNNSGQVIMQTGLLTVLPGGAIPTEANTPSFGIQLLSAQGEPIMQLGEQFSTGKPSMTFFNGVNQILVLDETGLKLYSSSGVLLSQFDDLGMTVFDPSGNPRVMIGELPDSQYGLGIYTSANNGDYIQIQPAVTALYAGTQSTTSTSFVALNGPSISFTVGASGEAMIHVSSIVGLPSVTSVATVGGAIGFSIDGGTTYELVSASYTGANIGFQSTGSNSILFSGLTPGTHTAEVMYSSANGQSINFSDTTIVVTPY